MLYEKSSGHKDMTISREGGPQEQPATTTSTQWQKKEKEMQYPATPRRIAKCCLSEKVHRKRRVPFHFSVCCCQMELLDALAQTSRRDAEFGSLMTAGTLDRCWCVSVLEILDFVYFKV